jgi:hypothetical protein
MCAAGLNERIRSLNSYFSVVKPHTIYYNNYRLHGQNSADLYQFISRPKCDALIPQIGQVAHAPCKYKNTKVIYQIIKTPT